MTPTELEGLAAAESAARVPVSSGGVRADYQVHVGRGLLLGLPEALSSVMERRAHWVVISDDTVGRLYGEEALDRMRAAGLRATLLTFPAGERHKTRRTWARLTDSLIECGLGRDGAIVALGGGVTGDLAGFVAATFMRGIPVVQVPTSLVAMIDASIGGKTGVDTPAGKNLVGAFHPPRVVLVDPEATLTLPVTERAQGLVEAVKHGAIRDEPYLTSLEVELEALLKGDPEATERAVLRSVRIKAEVVGQDERENGIREVLNFGHTIGHALEAASGFALSHGSAVAVGIVLEARLGESLGVTEAGTAPRLARLVERLGLSPTPAEDADIRKAVAFLGADKKRREGRTRCVLLERIGRVDSAQGWSRPVSIESVADVLEESRRHH